MTQPAVSDIGVGSVLRDTYEITSLLGKGGMGAVYLARHRRLPGKQVAVKLLLNGASLNPELYARFRREAEIASQLGHPNIVEVSDFDTLQDGTPFLVMEYLRGESLEHRLERGRLPLSEMLALTRQIGSALQAAHRAGVVHRDLKPANIFLVPTDSEGVMGERVKLLDFGISKMLDSQTLQTQEAVLIGTPQYMAPEQALGKNSEVGPGTDIFALGCIVYEMLSGRSPFSAEGSSLVQVVFRIVHAQPEPLTHLCPEAPGHVIAAVERALSKSTQDRQPDVSTFIAELTGSPLQAPTGVTPTFSSSRPASGSGTARFEVPGSMAADDGLGATHMPTPMATGRFGASSLAADDGLGATYLPAKASVPDMPAMAEEELASTHMPSAASRPPALVAEPPRVPQLAAPLSQAAPLVPLASVPAPVSPSPATPSRPNTMVGLLGALGVLSLLVIGAGVWRWTGQTHVTPVDVTPIQNPPVAPPPVTPPANPPVAVKPTPPSDPVAPGSPVVVQPVKPPPISSPPRVEPIQEEVKQMLKEAERYLAHEDPSEAVRLARLAQRTQITSAAYSVMTRAYCKLGDLSNARAMWRENSKVWLPQDRNQVKQYCKKNDIEF